VELVRRFLDSMAPDWLSFPSTIDAMCHADCIWENGAMPAARGTGAMKRLVLRLHESMGCAAIEVEYGAIAADGDAVLVERIDIVKDAGGRELGALPIVGVFHISEQRIDRWAEYFDPKLLLPRPAR
jgi:limonene-1,2-epoxide hydrolase